MSVAVQTRMYTVEDLEQLGDEFELDRGVLVPVMPGGESHGFVCVEVCTRLREYTRGKRLGRVYGNDTGFILERAPDTLRGPDVAFVKQERLTGTPKGGFFTGAPDLAVEVAWTASSVLNAIRKAAQYLEAGTTLVWILDLSRRRAVVFHLDGTIRTLHEQDLLDGGDVLPGLQIVLSVLLDGEG